MKKRHKTVYISGPITGVADYMDKFAKAEAELEGRNLNVINPARVLEPVTGALGYDELMAVCMVLLDACDAIYMLDGWEWSRGARVEHAVAKHKGMEIWAEEEKMCNYCNPFSNDFTPMNADSVQYSNLEIAVNCQGMLRARYFPTGGKTFDSQEIVNIKFCPMCGRKFRRVADE